MTKWVWLSAILLMGTELLLAQTDYTTEQQLVQRIQLLAKNHSKLVKTESLAKTYGGKDIWLITIGKGDTENKPALAVVGGVEGKHLLGVELAIGFAEHLLAGSDQDSIKSLLDDQVFYILPNMSPDATAQYFAEPQYERSGNARVIDTDRDGETGEDGYEDMDGDGKITMIRVLDPTGTYIPNPDEPRSMIKADQAKGQIGKYIVYSEGFDNDKDGQFNEDGDEGVHFNKNLTYNYKNFVAGAGEYAVSEIESRALLDFLYDAYNVYSVVTFGPNNNLSHPVPIPGDSSVRAASTQGAASSRSRRGPRRITAWSAVDARASQFASARYWEITGTGKDAPRTTAGSGDFSEWVYYHYGRLSFTTPGWWVPGKSESEADDPVAHYLKWAEQEGIVSDHFTEWTTITHPDFPGKEVEAGGLHPFVLHNPPYRMVSDVVEKHAEFVTALAGMAPFIEFAEVRTEKIDRELTRVSLKIFNRGLLPTLSQVGEHSNFLKRIAVNVGLSDGQVVVSGKPIQTVGAVPGRGHIALSWLIKGKGRMTIDAGSPNTGSDRVELSLD